MSLFENFPYTNLHNLNLDWIIQHIKEFEEHYPDIMLYINKKINVPNVNPMGDPGKFLMSLGNGNTSWEDIGEVYEDEIREAVNEWLNDHPEATTTVEDGSITLPKLNESLQKYVGRMGQLNLDFVGRTIRLDDYKSGQGMCAHMENGEVIIYYARYNYNLDNQRSVITKMDSTGNVIGVSDPINLGHSSDICYNETENVLMVAGVKAILYKVNPETLELIEIVTPGIPSNIIGVTYDNVNECYYMVCSNNHVYKATADFSIVTDEFIFPFNLTIQSIDYNNNHLFFPVNNPELIIDFDIENNYRLFNISALNPFMSGYYPIGETQCIAFYNDSGDFIVSGKPRGYNPDHPAEEVGLSILAFGYGNYITNIAPGSRPNVSMSSFDNYNEIYADSESTVFKPTGTSTEPFKMAAEAFFCLSAPLVKTNNIVLLGDFSTENIVAIDVNVSISGKSYAEPTNVKSITLDCFTGTVRHLNIIDTAEASFHAVRSRFDFTNIACSGASAGTAVLKAESGCVIVGEDAEILTNHKYSATRSTITITSGTKNYRRTEWRRIGRLEQTGSLSDAAIALSDSISAYHELMIIVYIYVYGNWRVSAMTNIAPEFLQNTTGMYFKGYDTVAGQENVSGLIQATNDTTITINSNAIASVQSFRYDVLVR